MLAQMVSELSALHTFVRGGDIARGHGRRCSRPRSARRFARDEAAGG